MHDNFVLRFCDDDIDDNVVGETTLDPDVVKKIGKLASLWGEDNPSHVISILLNRGLDKAISDTELEGMSEDSFSAEEQEVKSISKELRATEENRTKLANKAYRFIQQSESPQQFPGTALPDVETKNDARQLVADMYDFAFSPNRWDDELQAQNLQDMLNKITFSTKDAVELGRKLHRAHNTIQRSIVQFCLGILCGLAEQEYTDARNETAIATAKKVRDLVASDELPLGPFI